MAARLAAITRAGKPGGGRSKGGDQADDATLEPAEKRCSVAAGEPDEAGELDIRAVGVALQGGQQPDVNIIKVNGHPTIDYFVLACTWQTMAGLCGTMGP